MKKNTALINRRKILQYLGTTLITSPLLSLSGCKGNSSETDQTMPPDMGTPPDGTPPDGMIPGGSVTESSPPATNNTSWLSGGTSAMEAEFPPSTDPFSSGLGNMCTITDEFTIGPCYFDVTDDRDDISEGQDGVPMTLVMKLVDAACEPIEGAVIEVWWCNSEGIYSADNSQATGTVSNFNTSFCSGDDAESLNSRWFRGIKTTDSSGNVYFKACFPGWYTSRATHIHFRIVLNGNQQLISQFGFDDDLSSDIHANHSEYTGMANPTTNATDTVFPSSGYESYLFEVEKQWDSSMMAYKAIQLSSYT